MQSKTDVIILGSGIGSSILGTILAANGLKVTLIDKNCHPKFAIGESTIPQASAMMKVLAHRYNVPELAHLSSFKNIHDNISEKCGIKRNFGFVYHDTQQGYTPKHCHQLGALGSQPLRFGAEAPVETHLFRQDIDAYLAQLAVHYGCTLLQNTQIEDITIATDYVQVITKQDTLTAQFIVDGSGYASVLANRYGLRAPESELKAHSRSIFTHMIDIKPYDDCVAKPKKPLPAKWHEGTLHHVFDGGWLWVIPFDNYPSAKNPMVSVGLQFDTKKFPMNDKSPEEEFRDFIKQHPTIADQFKEAKSIRPWVKTGRLQYASTASCGDRFALLSHTFGFIDPLYSRGLLNTGETINLLAGQLLKAFKDNDFTKERFGPLDDLQRSLIHWNDKMVHASYVTFANYELWNAWFRVWGLNQPLGMFRMANALKTFEETGDKQYLDQLDETKNAGFFAPDFPEYEKLFNDAYQVICDFEKSKLTAKESTEKIYTLLHTVDFLPPHFPYTCAEETFGKETLMQHIKKYKWFKKTRKEKKLL